MITIELTESDVRNVRIMMDAAVRHLGLDAAAFVSMFVAKIDAAVASAAPPHPPLEDHFPDK